MADECQIFTGGVNSSGYGMCYVNGKQIGAHRLAYTMAKGPIPKGMWVLHSCDVKKCVNPNHLRLGTAKENTADALARGQIKIGQKRPAVRGENHVRALLTNAMASEMKRMRREGASTKYLMEFFGVKKYTVYQIISGRGYKDAK